MARIHRVKRPRPDVEANIVGAVHAVWCQDIAYTVCQDILYTSVLTDLGNAILWVLIRCLRHWAPVVQGVVRSADGT